MDKKFPSDQGILFLLAEAIRQEAGGKISLLGLFANGEVVLEADAKLPANFPLAFYFLVGDGEGEFDVKMQLLSPSGTDLIPKGTSGPPANKLPRKSLTMSVQIPGFQAPEIGTYKVILYLDGRPFERRFSVQYSY